MIFNRYTQSHPFHQGDKRIKPVQPRSDSLFGTAHCTGTLDEKCEWMRKRQQRKQRPPQEKSL